MRRDGTVAVLMWRRVAPISYTQSDNPSYSRALIALIAIRVSFDATVISFMSIIPMLHVFVFPSVTDVGITRHRQNTYLPLYASKMDPKA
jgi:hypothetical protein